MNATRCTTQPCPELKRLEEPKGGKLIIAYAPEKTTDISENPPRFSWLPVVDERAHYVIRISDTKNLAGENCYEYSGIHRNFFTPSRTLEPGNWFWAYAEWDSKAKKRCSNWSTVRSFCVPDSLPKTPLLCPKDRRQFYSREHPRLWLNKEQIANFRDGLDADPSLHGFDKFYTDSVSVWLDKSVMQEPKPYSKDLRTAEVWRRTYIECQELIYAIRHMAVAGQLLDDQTLKQSAKRWLIAAASWDVEGTTSRTYSDEWAFRVAAALAWGYDWLYDELDESERVAVRNSLRSRTQQVADHIIKNAKIQIFPYDSHAIRAVSSVLVPCSIALLHDTPEAEEWLNFAIEFLATVYSPWGDAQGGWAEGPHYWMTGLAYLSDAANLLRNYCGIDLYKRTFFQNTGDFPLYAKPPNTLRATFGDDATQGDPVCLKMGYLMSQFARVTGNGVYQWYFEEVLKNDPGTADEFYNYGWWDLNFDWMVMEHDYPRVDAVRPVDIESLRWFRGVGWAAVQHCLDEQDRHIHLLFKSSPFGSISHSHADQNAFCFSAYGEDLAIQSGYYVAFNSSMHLNWRKQTRSKNAILINGKGQYAGEDKSKAIRASGRILSAEQCEDHVLIKAEATEAYKIEVPEVDLVERDFYFVQNRYFVVVDRINAQSPVSIEWLLHANGPFDLGEKSFRYTGRKAGFYTEFIWSSSGEPSLEQVNGFPDVEPSEYAGLSVSSHVVSRFPKKRTHRIVTLIVPYPIGDEQRIFNFIDDQGYDCGIYFTDSEENSFRIVVPKN